MWLSHCKQIVKDVKDFATNVGTLARHTFERSDVLTFLCRNNHGSHAGAEMLKLVEHLVDRSGVERDGARDHA